MVGNRAPVIDILVNGNLAKKNAWVNANEEVEFNASATLDIEGDEINFTWDFGDGSETVTGAVVNHTFSDEKNNYKVTLTVTDGTDEAIAIITINVHIS
jgi:PKD repeat protein